jgi:hypothetical protein
MPYLSAQEFETVLLSKPLDLIVEEFIFQGEPYVFRNQFAFFNLLIKHLSKELGVAEQNMTIVGSAKVGFSLNPENFPRQFSETSDIDVLVISEQLFDTIWMTLLKWHYPRRFVSLGKTEGEWQQRRRKEIFWGWLVPNEIQYEGISFPEVLKPLRDLSVKWFNAFQSLSLYPEFAARTVTGRLYRTREHALRYHVEGLRQIHSRLVRTRKGG